MLAHNNKKCKGISKDNLFQKNRSMRRYFEKKKIDYPAKVKLKKKSQIEVTRCLLRFNDRYPDGHIYPSQGKIAKYIGFTRRTVNTAVKELSQFGLIKKIYRHRHSCVYVLSDLLKNTKIKFFFMSVLPFISLYSENFSPIKSYINYFNIYMGYIQCKSIYEEGPLTSKLKKVNIFKNVDGNTQYKSVYRPKRAITNEYNQKREELCVVNKNKAQQDPNVYPGCNTYNIFKETICENKRKMQIKKRNNEFMMSQEEANKMATAKRNKNIQKTNEICEQVNIAKKNSIPLNKWINENKQKLNPKTANFLKFLSTPSPEPEVDKGVPKITRGAQNNDKDTNSHDPL